MQAANGHSEYLLSRTDRGAGPSLPPDVPSVYRYEPQVAIRVVWAPPSPSDSLSTLSTGYVKMKSLALKGNELQLGVFIHSIHNFFQKHQTRWISLSKLTIDP